MCACARACMRACMCACMCACVCVRAPAHVSVHVMHKSKILICKMCIVKQLFICYTFVNLLSIQVFPTVL